MALNQRKLQKKKERRQAKRKSKRREMVSSSHSSLTTLLNRVDDYPILHAAMSSSLFDTGIGHVLLSREGPQRQVVAALFLVDVFCLGVKDAMIGMRPRSDYERDIWHGRTFEAQGHTPLTPADARKLVEDAVQYASDLGIPPHADYHPARRIFGSIDATESHRQFTFGKNGKPFFIAGPYDDSHRCRAIMQTLETNCGPDAYQFMMPVGGNTMVTPLDDDDIRYLG